MSTLSTDKALEKLNLFGIFSICFFVAFVATYFYSPVVRTNASESDTVTVGAEIEDVVSVSLSSNELDFEFTPTPEGVFDSKYVDVSVKTNTFGGYELYFSSIDNDTDMVHDTVTNGTNDGTSGSTSTVTDVISSDFSGTTTGTNMKSNKWGYSLDTTNPILDKEYSIIPTLNNRLTLANTSSSTPGTTETKRVYIGVKVDSTLKSGTYAKVLKFTGVAHESPDIYPGETYDFDYTGGEQTFTAPVTGYYKLEVWGAQGGSYSTWFSGGLGGYSTGDILLNSNQEIFINVGGEGSAAVRAVSTGGYNGGGNSGYWNHNSYASAYGSGGGATTISESTISGQSASSHDLIIVAGGGGGGAWRSSDNLRGNGGSGGGLTGENGTTTSWSQVGTGGTQTSGGYVINISDGRGVGSFLQGGEPTSSTSAWSGGGSGYYGGGAGDWVGAGGGSGYIGDVLNGSTTNGQRSGSGFARITYLGTSI